MPAAKKKQAFDFFGGAASLLCAVVGLHYVMLRPGGDFMDPADGGIMIISRP